MWFAFGAVLAFLFFKLGNMGWYGYAMVMGAPLTLAVFGFHLFAHYGVNYQGVTLVTALALAANICFALSALLLPDGADNYSNYVFFTLIKNPPAVMSTLAVSSFIVSMICDCILLVQRFWH
ncbi:hypothetical protein [Celerinatantimonas sp. MCCC 1A17872]|uniref:hypothetical protein n=1 Tax=Celerinatantimonas sp. MCCC 1A17872 TaxID=3177514 RepID=UPI0038C40935